MRSMRHLDGHRPRQPLLLLRRLPQTVLAGPAGNREWWHCNVVPALRQENRTVFRPREAARHQILLAVLPVGGLPGTPCPATSVPRPVTPVRLPEGRLRLLPRLARRGHRASQKRTGMACIAALGAGPTMARGCREQIYSWRTARRSRSLVRLLGCSCCSRPVWADVVGRLRAASLTVNGASKGKKDSAPSRRPLRQRRRTSSAIRSKPSASVIS